MGIGWGQEDPWIPAEQAARLAGALPGTPSITVLADTGHLAPLEAADAVLAAIVRWLAAA